MLFYTLHLMVYRAFVCVSTWYGDGGDGLWSVFLGGRFSRVLIAPGLAGDVLLNFVVDAFDCRNECRFEELKELTGIVHSFEVRGQVDTFCRDVSSKISDHHRCLFDEIQDLLFDDRFVFDGRSQDPLCTRQEFRYFEDDFAGFDCDVCYFFGAGCNFVTDSFEWIAHSCLFLRGSGPLVNRRGRSRDGRERTVEDRLVNLIDLEHQERERILWRTGFDLVNLQVSR